MYVDGVEPLFAAHSSFPSANISSTFDPPTGHSNFDYVFDFTGETRPDRTEMVRIILNYIADVFFSSHIPDSDNHYI